MAADSGLPNYWYPAMTSRQLGKKPVTVKLLDQELLLVRSEGKAYALASRCAHRGVPLAEGRCEFPGTISCPFHGWTYDLRTGELVAALTDGPESSVVGKIRNRAYAVEERAGLIWVFVGEGAPPPLEDDVPPELLQQGVFAGHRVREFVGNWRIAMEGAVDPSHPFYLHRNAWLSGPFQMPAARGRHWPETMDDDRYFTYSTDEPISEGEYPGLGSWPSRSRLKFRRLAKLDVRGFLPCGAMVKGLNFNQPFITYSWYVPVGADHYRWFQCLATDVKGLRRLWARAKYYLWLRFMYQGQFLDQDARMNELVHPFYAEQDGWTKERFFRPDVVITAWRSFVDDRARQPR
jgi:nitrite reductase/ring-hydroxylating ferredoxin subunit